MESQIVNERLMVMDTHWSAQEMRARAEIKKAFEADEKHQWLIGDLLNMIAPNEDHGGHNSPESTEKLRQVAEENGKSLTTIREYRAVARMFSPNDRVVGHTVCLRAQRVFGAEAPEKIAELLASGVKLTGDLILEMGGKITGHGKNKPLDRVIRDTYDSIHRFATKEKVELDDQDKVMLRLLKLDIDILLGE